MTGKIDGPVARSGARGWGGQNENENEAGPPTREIFKLYPLINKLTLKAQ